MKLFALLWSVFDTFLMYFVPILKFPLNQNVLSNCGTTFIKEHGQSSITGVNKYCILIRTEHIQQLDSLSRQKQNQQMQNVLFRFSTCMFMIETIFLDKLVRYE